MTIRLSHDTCNAVNASYGASSFPGTQWEGFCTPSFTLSAVFMQDTWHGAFTAHHARGAQKPRAWWQAPHVSDEQDAKCRAPHVSDEQDATHAAWSPAGSRALTVMAAAAGRHAARSSVGASAPAAAALKSHPTVPVALPAPLCSVPPTSLPAMPVAPPHPKCEAWEKPGEGRERGQLRLRAWGAVSQAAGQALPISARNSDRPRWWDRVPWRRRTARSDRH